MLGRRREGSDNLYDFLARFLNYRVRLVERPEKLDPMGEVGRVQRNRLRRDVVLEEQIRKEGEQILGSKVAQRTWVLILELGRGLDGNFEIGQGT